MSSRIFCPIIPPQILEAIARRGAPHQRERALRTLIQTEQLRGARVALGRLTALAAIGFPDKKRSIYDAQGKYALPGNSIRVEGNKKTKDVVVNEAYDGSGAHYDFFRRIYQRNSLDDKGLALDSTVHYGQKYDNAFWNGRQMVYGDGDGDLFGRFTLCLDVIGHELTHGVVQFEANLSYEGQSGALNESFADVFGALLKQHHKKQKADEADWLIGAGLFTQRVKGKALRRMKAPGNAYDDSVIGKDPQPGHMKDYNDTWFDNGGVHINSGIPNHAFYLVAIEIGGYAWEKAGLIWYVALRDRIRRRANFKRAAKATFRVAGELFGVGSREQEAVRKGWEGVGVSFE